MNWAVYLHSIIFQSYKEKPRGYIASQGGK